MKTLTAQLLRHVLLLAAAIQLQTHSLAQCTVNAGADLTKCFGSLALLGANVTATGQSPFQYSWNGGATWSASPTYNVTATVNNTYTVSVQDANGCISTDQISLTVLALPTADAGADVSICPAAPVQLCGTASSPNGAITTQIWLPGGSASACINVAPSSTTTYTYTVGDAAGCQASNTVQVTVYNALPVNAGTDQTLCLSVGSQQLTGIPAGGTWSGTGVNAAGLFTASTIGNYTLTYTRVSAQGCSYSDHMVMTVIDPSPPNGGPDYVVCIDTPTMSLPNVGTWSGSALVTPGGIFTPSVAGSYVLTVTNTSGGCTVTDNISIDVMALPTVNAGVDQNICTGGTAQLNGIASSVNGTITNVAWGGSWVSNASILNPTATPPGTSNYILYVTDNFNCTTSDQMTVFVNSYPMVNAGSDETVCSNALPTQLAGFSPAGGTWSGAGVNASGIFTPTIAGNFTLTYTYTSAQGCTASDTKVMTVIAPDVINAGVDQSVCLNANPIQLMSGGTWTGSAYVTAAGIFTPSAIGSYTLTYTTTSGLCQSSDQLVVTVLPLPSVNAGADQTICTGQVVSLIATASSANGIISNYAWNGGTVANASAQITTSTPTVATTYTITATDASACYASDNITIQVNSLPAVNAGTDISLCNQPIGQQLGGFSPSGGVWSGANVNASGIFTPDGTGVFTLTYCYTNGNGCTACDDVNVTVTNAPVVNAGVDEAVCLNAAPFNLVTVSTGGTWTATAVLTTGGLFTPNSAGTHTCTYTTGSGTCMASDTKTVTVNSLPAVNAGADASICAGHNHNINANVNGGTGPYNYVWSNAATLSDSDTEDVTAYPNVNTTYSLIVTDANNCSSTDNISINVVALAVADFDVADTSCVNAAIAFTNASTGAASYLWSLGNGSTSTLTSPISTYTLSGSYAVSLTAYNAIGCESTTSGSIEIIDAPVALFTTNALAGCSPMVVSVSNSSTGVGNIYEWNFDGATNSDVSPAPATFSVSGSTGTFDISLSVENMCGTDVHIETITVNPQPNASFSTALSSQCSPVTTQFVNTTTGNADSYLWDLGNGTNTAAASPTDVVYTTDDDSAQFTVKLTAYNTCGADSIEQVVMVLPNTVEMNLQPSATVGCAPLFIEFNNATTGATNYYFDFDDGSNSSVVSPNHLFDEAGIYDVVFMANDGCSYDTTVVTIEILPTPTIEVSSNSLASCPDQEVEFFSITTGTVQSISWDFGDGGSATGANQLHTFTTGNDFGVSAMVQADNGCYATDYLLYTVHPKPTAVMSASPATGCSPLSVCTDNQTLGNIQSTWNFGEGGDLQSANACHEYINATASAIDYEIELLVMNEFMCTDSAFQVVSVQPQPVAQFSLSSTESCFPLEQITNTPATIGATNYQWVVNGAAYSNDVDATFSFDTVGVHTVELIAMNDFGCAHSFTETYTIHPKPQIAIAPSPSQGCAPLDVTFLNSTTDGSTYNWAFGYGQQSAMTEPTVTFDTQGYYDVQLFATSIHGCENVAFYADMIEVFGLPQAGFTYTPNDEIIYELDVAFADTSIGAVSYSWDFGDGFNSIEPEPVHHYHHGGVYYVEQTVTNENGCNHSQTQMVNIDNTFYIYIPNSFTPDNDGINDVFAPLVSDAQYIKFYEMVVIDRWGEVIFKSDNPEVGWTGNVRSGEYYAHNDCFTYNIRIEFNNQTVNQQHTGQITMLR